MGKLTGLSFRTSPAIIAHPTSVMSRRRSARLQGKASPGPQPTVNFDERLDFLRLDAGDDDDVDLPLRRRFEHRIEGASGPVEVVYWPARAARKQVPEQVTSFILGRSIQLAPGW